MVIRLIIPPDGIETTANPPSERHSVKIVGTEEKNVVNAYALSASPSILTTNYGVLYRQDIEATRTAFNHWDIDIPYGPREQENGAMSWDFDTTGGTVHITQGRQEVNRYPADTAPNQLGAIAVDGNEVKGTEIIVPAMKVNVQFNHPFGFLTLSRAKYLSDITGTVNSDPFLTFKPGEVLFLGARGSDGTTSDATVNYSFAMAVNATGLTIGDIAGVDKKAWDVSWIRYADTITTAGGEDLPTRVPKFVYVDRVYESIPMATALGFA